MSDNEESVSRYSRQLIICIVFAVLLLIMFIAGLATKIIALIILSVIGLFATTIPLIQALVVLVRNHKFSETQSYNSNSSKNSYSEHTDTQSQYNLNNSYSPKPSISSYEEKHIMTNNEVDYYHRLLKLCPNTILITPQVPLSSIVNKKNDSRYINELFRTIDFGLFDKETFELLALVEINDLTHTRYDRAERDRKVQAILEDAGMRQKLIIFWTTDNNSDEYVLKKLKEVIGYGYF